MKTAFSKLLLLYFPIERKCQRFALKLAQGRIPKLLRFVVEYESLLANIHSISQDLRKENAVLLQELTEMR
jgi:hypothetical protein